MIDENLKKRCESINKYLSIYLKIVDKSTEDIISQHLVDGYKVIENTIEVNTILLIRLLDKIEKLEKEITNKVK